jgi:hypothetical protein
MTRDKMRRAGRPVSRRTNAAAVGLPAKVVGIFALSAFMSCSAGQAPNFKTEVEVTPAEDPIGERLFLDTRFAQYFATHMTGVNPSLAVGDPVVQQVQTLNGVYRGHARANQSTAAPGTSSPSFRASAARAIAPTPTSLPTAPFPCR